MNFAVYTPVSFLMSGVMGSYAVLFADVVSWIVAVLFAFFVNKRFVFKDGIEKENSGNEDRLSARRRTTVQLAEFAGLRIVSLGVELAFHVVFTQVLHLNDIVVKVIASVFVVVSNYIFSKFIIFKNKKIK